MRQSLRTRRLRGIASRCVSLGLLGVLGVVSARRKVRAARVVVVLGSACVVVGGSLPTRALAHVPRADRVIDAVAAANVAGRRVRALRYRLKLHIGDGPPVAVGDLVSHPTGLARLELRASGGLIERHLLLGDQHSAARNARLLVRPRAFLPPLFVLQSNSGTVLEAALGTLGVDRKLVGLAPCGENDCYVIGDPTRAVRRPRAREDLDVELDGGAEVGAEVEKDEVVVVEDGDVDPDRAESPEPIPEPIPEPRGTPANSPDASEAAAVAAPVVGEGPATPQYFATLWVDTVDHSVRRIESRDGVKIVLGPYVSFERLKVPLWWSIEEPGKRPVRFEVDGVVEVNAPAAAFSKTWLMAPVTGPTPEAPTGEPQAPATAPATAPTATPPTSPTATPPSAPQAP